MTPIMPIIVVYFSARTGAVLGAGGIHGTGYDGDVPTRQHAGPGPTGPDIPEPSLAERARTLVSIARIGSLSTHSRKVAGFPFGSVMPYAIDDLGRPVFFISSMAMHTQNLHQDARASLLITQPDSSGDPLGAARVTLLGATTEVSPAEVRDLYFARHENAKYWQEYTDFAYYRLHVSNVYYIGGFGVMGWVPAEEYAGARPDPLSDTAQEIIRHMNADHPDALLLIVRRFAGEAADEARMTAVDRLGFHLRLQTGDRVHGRRVAFPREVRNTEEARAIFIEMLREARSSSSN
jgi:heme iron utilization protein